MLPVIPLVCALHTYTLQSSAIQYFLHLSYVWVNLLTLTFLFQPFIIELSDQRWQCYVFKNTWFVFANRLKQVTILC